MTGTSLVPQCPRSDNAETEYAIERKSEMIDDLDRLCETKNNIGKKKSKKPNFNVETRPEG